MSVKLQSYENIYLHYKKEQIMVDTKELLKAGALWRTLRHSFVSYDRLIFLLLILRDY